MSLVSEAVKNVIYRGKLCWSGGLMEGRGRFEDPEGAAWCWKA